MNKNPEKKQEALKKKPSVPKEGISTLNTGGDLPPTDPDHPPR